ARRSADARNEVDHRAAAFGSGPIRYVTLHVHSPAFGEPHIGAAKLHARTDVQRGGGGWIGRARIICRDEFLFRLLTGAGPILSVASAGRHADVIAARRQAEDAILA